jgi:hypothetical protein
MSHGNASWDYFNVNYICSITGEEKLLIAQFTSNNGEGNTAPNRNEHVAKFVPNPDAPITRIDFTNTSGSGSYDTGSNLSALGSGDNITPAAAIPFPTNVQVGSRAEITDTRKMYNYEPTGYITTDGLYTVIKFTENGTFTPTSSFDVEYLVVGGGGGANTTWGSSGGGGAGGYRADTGHGVTAQTYNITIGAGGSAKVGSGVADNGGNSIFDTITSLGGGGGGQYSSGAGAVGGSGGGGGDSGSGGAGTSGQGNAGGGSSASGGGGGGGAGGAGAVATGGVGLQNDITGTNLYYAGGGGGAKGSSSNAGGSGGGGTGGGQGYASTSGTDGLGGGAGAGGSLAGGNSGGSGVVILRFLTSGNTYTTSLPLNEWKEIGA